MKLFKKFRPTLFVLALTAIAPQQPAYAFNLIDCFKNALQGKPVEPLVQEVSPERAREAILAEVGASKLPAFIRVTDSGEVPVVLINKETAPGLKRYLDQSLGVQIQLQPDYKNDHGMIRVRETIIDVDTPGARNFGEIHQTGIAWKGLYDYLKRRGNQSNDIIELSFQLTPEERRTADVYHRMRRAAVIRAKFTFGGGGNEPHPNLLNGGGEHCFVYSKGSAISEQIRELGSKLNGMAVLNVDQILEKPEVKTYLLGVEKRLLESNSNDPNVFNSNIVLMGNERDVLLTLLKPGMDPKLFADFLVGYSASRAYAKLISDLNISGGASLGELSSPRLSAVLIYAPNEYNQQFKDATFTTKGIFVNWDDRNQHPLH